MPVTFNNINQKEKTMKKPLLIAAAVIGLYANTALADWESQEAAPDKEKYATPTMTLSGLLGNDPCILAISNTIGQNLDPTEPGGTLGNNDSFWITFTFIISDPPKI